MSHRENPVTDLETKLSINSSNEPYLSFPNTKQTSALQRTSESSPDNQSVAADINGVTATNLRVCIIWKEICVNHWLTREREREIEWSATCSKLDCCLFLLFFKKTWDTQSVYPPPWFAILSWKILAFKEEQQQNYTFVLSLYNFCLLLLNQDPKSYSSIFIAEPTRMTVKTMKCERRSSSSSSSSSLLS